MEPETVFYVTCKYKHYMRDTYGLLQLIYRMLAEKLVRGGRWRGVVAFFPVPLCSATIIPDTAVHGAYQA